MTGLEPVIDLEGWESLFGHQINLVRDDPRGFLPMSAFTLSEDPDLRQVNVRRLLMLLRRLALREGQELVFEPNSFRLRASIERQFRRLLESLYTRGAFAGDTPDEAFRVTVADDAVSPPESVDLGRLVIEIQVAPSRPLQFLTVRLIQEGIENFTVETA
ncbi:MAG: phage tail sheath C-terminal domain-containing protein [Verrucomicrobiota bacterium]